MERRHTAYSNFQPYHIQEGIGRHERGGEVRTQKLGEEGGWKEEKKRTEGKIGKIRVKGRGMIVRGERKIFILSQRRVMLSDMPFQYFNLQREYSVRRTGLLLVILIS